MNALLRGCRCQVLLGIMMLLSGSSTATAVDWDGGASTSEWLDAMNWEFDTIPTTADTATIVNDTALITGVFVPPVQTLQLGSGVNPGGLTMTGGGGAATLEVIDSVLIGNAGALNIGPGTAHLLTGEVLSRGAVTVALGGQITTFQEFVQNGAGSLTALTGGQLNTPALRIVDGELRGSGQVSGDVTVGGSGRLTAPTVSPGSGIGTLDISGNLQLNSNSELLVEIDTSGSTVRADQLLISGTATLGGLLTLNLTGNGAIGLNNQVEILQAGGVQPDTFFDQINVLSTGTQAVVVTFIPMGDFAVNPGVNIHTSLLIGDMFNDGVIDEKDARLFAWAIRDVNTYNEEFYLSGFSDVCGSLSGYCGAAPESLADIDGDLSLTFADMPAFLSLVDESGGNAAAAWHEMVAVFNQSPIPEPAALWLAMTALAITGSCRRRR